MSDPILQLIGHNICPYVQRVVILLQEKQLSYKRIDIDLADKVKLRQLSVTAKVPLLLIDKDKSLFESQVICTYLDEISVGSMLPPDPFEKARHCAWIALASEVLNAIANIIYVDHTPAQLAASLEKIRLHFILVEQQLEGGGYFSGEDFLLIDAVYATIFRYFEVFIIPAGTEPFVNLTKLNLWRELLAKRQSVQQAVPVNYPELLIEFMRPRAMAMSRLLSHFNECAV
ncbi:MAG: glutathione S-transferase family protein [Pseudomonadales bacterium]|nr:glutathione S-transferase family protein [Pseudomonadales bacterium]NRA18317.1 glutathione S-transferase family protein [Oceanospirillaceae bacterium]